MNEKYNHHYGDRKSQHSFSGGAHDPVEIARIPNGETTLFVEKNKNSAYFVEQFETGRTVGTVGKKHYVIVRSPEALRLFVNAGIAILKEWK